MEESFPGGTPFTRIRPSRLGEESLPDLPGVYHEDETFLREVAFQKDKTFPSGEDFTLEVTLPLRWEAFTRRRPSPGLGGGCTQGLPVREGFP